MAKLNQKDFDKEYQKQFQKIKLDAILQTAIDITKAEPSEAVKVGLSVCKREAVKIE